MSDIIQNRDGLPVELTEEKRFFRMLGPKKDATPAGWNDPAHWQYLDDIPEGQAFGFAIGNESNYLLIDGDHVRNPFTGEIVPWVKSVYKRITAVSDTYVEVSMSGTGFHMICDLGDYGEAFEPETNADIQKIVAMDPLVYSKLPEVERDRVPKIELFYHARGRYCYLTGNHKGEALPVARDEQAAAIFYELLKVREEMHAKYSTAGQDAARKQGGEVDARTKQQILSALPYISAIERETWIHVGIALYNCGFDEAVFDEWSKWEDQRRKVRCDKYHAKEIPKIWKSFRNTRSRWNAGTIFMLAQENGWKMTKDRESLEPEEYSDVDQAALFVREYGDKVRYSGPTGFLVYNGKVWEESELDAQALSQQLTDAQLAEAKKRVRKAQAQLNKVIEAQEEDQTGAKHALKREEAFRKYVLSRRSTTKIQATLKEAAPNLKINIEDLDADAFILNTPAGVVDLKTGNLRPHRARDFCTKITAVSPGTDNAEIFRDFLSKLTCGDVDLQNYLQEIAGMCAIGRVLSESLIIAMGDGGNGKSTFFNLLHRVLGSYAWAMSSEILTADSRKNKAPELAELRGKRLAIAAELEEGMRLDTGTVKKICSTDPINAEKKFCAPFSFIPSHSIVLYTNFLPKVGTNDRGTWDRIIVIPFNARFRGESGEKKDFCSILFEECGPAVLSWVIEGAKRFVRNEYKLNPPKCVKDAIADYRTDNDWLQGFIDERCIVDSKACAPSGAMYTEYKKHCAEYGEFTRSATAFKQAMIAAGYEWQHTRNGKLYFGIRIRTHADRLPGAV